MKKIMILMIFLVLSISNMVLADIIKTVDGIYEGEVKDGTAHGLGVFKDNNGDICKGAWYNGNRIGLFTKVNEKKNFISSSVYIDGKLFGKEYVMTGEGVEVLFNYTMFGEFIEDYKNPTVYYTKDGEKYEDYGFGPELVAENYEKTMIEEFEIAIFRKDYDKIEKILQEDKTLLNEYSILLTNAFLNDKRMIIILLKFGWSPLQQYPDTHYKLGNMIVGNSIFSKYLVESNEIDNEILAIVKKMAEENKLMDFGINIGYDVGEKDQVEYFERWIELYNLGIVRLGNDFIKTFINNYSKKNITLEQFMDKIEYMHEKNVEIDDYSFALMRDLLRDLKSPEDKEKLIKLLFNINKETVTYNDLLFFENGKLIDYYLSHGLSINEKLSNNETLLEKNSEFAYYIIDRYLKENKVIDTSGMVLPTLEIFNRYVLKNDNEMVLDFLLKKGLNLNHKDDDGADLLQLAIEEDAVKIAELLISKGLKADRVLETKKDKSSNTPLGFYVRAVEMLISYGGTSRDYRDYTPLMLAAEKNSIKSLKMLMNKNVKLDTYNREKENALSLAIRNGNEEVVKLLVSKGANKEFLSEYNNTPLMIAILNNKLNIVKLLLENKVKLEAKNTAGYTPLMLAVYNDFTDIAKLLIENKAQISVKTFDGESLLEIAKSDTMRELLLGYGAKW